MAQIYCTGHSSLYGMGPRHEIIDFVFSLSSEISPSELHVAANNIKQVLVLYLHILASDTLTTHNAFPLLRKKIVNFHEAVFCVSTRGLDDHCVLFNYSVFLCYVPI